MIVVGLEGLEPSTKSPFFMSYAPTDDQPGGGFEMEVTVTTLLAIGLGPSVLVLLGGVMLAVIRTLAWSGARDPGVTGAAAGEG